MSSIFLQSYYRFLIYDNLIKLANDNYLFDVMFPILSIYDFFYFILFINMYEKKNTSTISSPRNLL